MIKLINEQRQNKTMPNIWSEMRTKQIQVIIEELPANGEVTLISAFDPSFWKTQYKTQKITVTEEKRHHKFHSTNEVWIVTRCRDAEGKEEDCVQSTTARNNGSTTGQAKFELIYQIVRTEEVAKEDIDWSLYITIEFGFTLMFIAFLYFEWRAVFSCVRKCKEKICGRTAQRQIGFVDGDDPNVESDKLSEGDSAEHDGEGSQDEGLDEQINQNLEKLNKTKSHNSVDNTPNVGFHK